MLQQQVFLQAGVNQVPVHALEVTPGIYHLMLRTEARQHQSVKVLLNP